MKVVVLHNEPAEDAAVEESDVLAQRDAVVAALNRLGHSASCLGCTLDLETVQRRLMELRPNVVFNLVESLGGTDRLMSLATILLDAREIPYTGTRTDAILATSNKLAAKARLRDAGLPTPDWLSSGAENTVAICSSRDSLVRGASSAECWIIKPVFEHASFSVDDDAVVTAHGTSDLETKLRDRARRIGRPLFAEQFVEGREFNLSMLNEVVLPPAEIDFSAFPQNKPRIVGHQAKWDQNSFEYQQTPRRFDFPDTDGPLLAQLSSLALNCWKLFALSGYARVDFRVDSECRPWILEVNANPCLSPDAGFAAALSQAGISYDDAVRQIIECAVRWASEPVDSSRRKMVTDTTAPEGRRPLAAPDPSPRLLTPRM